MRSTKLALSLQRVVHTQVFPARCYSTLATAVQELENHSANLGLSRRLGKLGLNALARLSVQHTILQCRRASSSRVGDSHAKVDWPDGSLKQTSLHGLHIEKGGKMVPFAGYSMPVQYADLGVGESHKWTREKASIFDVGHMYTNPKC